jgi:hypothetical protein
MLKKRRTIMNTLTRSKFLIVLTTGALIIGSLKLECGWVQPVQAQGGVWKSTNFLKTDLVSVGTGREFRVCLGLAADSVADSISFRFDLRDHHGSVLYESPLITVPRGQFRFSGVSPTQLPTNSEPAVMLQVTIEGEPGVKEADLFGAWQLIGPRSGTTSNTRFLLIVEALP